MAAPQNIIAVVFDFDDTLTDDSTTKLLADHGVDTGEFWQRNRELVKQGWNATLSYLTLLLENVGKGKPFGKLRNADLRAFGVFDPRKEGSPKKAFEQLVAPKRVKTMNAPRYRRSDELGALLRGAVKQMCVELDVRTKTVRTS